MERTKQVTGARSEILGKIKANLDPVKDSLVREQAVQARLINPPAHIIPKRSLGDKAAQLALFREMAEEVAATTKSIDSLDKLPEEVVNYLVQHNLPPQIKTDSNPLLANLNWAAQATLKVKSGRAEIDDLVSVTAAFAGVAETGTVILASGPKSPTTLNFLPENHIVVLPTSRLHGTYEEVWKRLRDSQNHGSKTLPRTVNWITGPSRTGDIEQTMQLGIHGPLRLHVILVRNHGQIAE